MEKLEILNFLYLDLDSLVVSLVDVPHIFCLSQRSDCSAQIAEMGARMFQFVIMIAYSKACWFGERETYPKLIKITEYSRCRLIRFERLTV